MKIIKYVLFGIVALGIIGAVLMPKNKKIKTDINKTEIVKETSRKDNQTKKLIDLDKSKFWIKFDPIVKIRIYQMIEDKDCAGLQSEFNITADNMDKLQSTGKSASRNLDLMDFLQDQMKELDCHN